MTQFEDVSEIDRDRWGRPMVLLPDQSKKVPYSRCTTFVGALEDTYNLMGWKQRMTAVGLAQRPDLLLRVSSLGADPGRNDPGQRKWKQQMDATCEDATEAAKASAAATTGTALHELTERIDRGLDVGFVPEAYQRHLANYEAATRKLTHHHIEQFTVHDDLRIGGTPDRIVQVDGVDGMIIADVKTGSIEFGTGKIAMQLAVYAHSQLYTPDGTRTPVDGLRTDTGIIIALDAHTGDCTLKWIDLTQAWDAVQLAADVRAWRKKKAGDFLADFDTGEVEPEAEARGGYQWETVGQPKAEPVTQPALGTARNLLVVRVAQARTVDQLMGLWRDNRDQWDEHLTDVAARRKQELLTRKTA